MRNVTQWLHYNRSHIFCKHFIELTRFFLNTGVPTFSLLLAYYSKNRDRRSLESEFLSDTRRRTDDIKILQLGQCDFLWRDFSGNDHSRSDRQFCRLPMILVSPSFSISVRVSYVAFINFPAGQSNQKSTTSSLNLRLPVLPSLSWRMACR